MDDKPKAILKPIAKRAVEVESEKQAEKAARKEQEKAERYNRIDAVGKKVLDSKRAENDMGETDYEDDIADYEEDDESFDDEAGTFLSEINEGNERGKNDEYYEKQVEGNAPISVNLTNMLMESVDNLNEEQIESIADNIETVAKTERTNVAALKEKGELSKEDIRRIGALERLGIEPERFTLEEIKQIIDYKYGLDEGLQEEKVEYINTIIQRALYSANGSKGYFDNDLRVILREMGIKASDWLEGRSDNVLEVDAATVDDVMGTNAPDSAMVYRFSLDKAIDRVMQLTDLSVVSAKERFETMDFEEMIELGYLQDDDMLVIGPFTKDDLETIERAAAPFWSSSMDQREGGTRYVEGHETIETKDGPVDKVITSRGRHYTTLAKLSNGNFSSLRISETGINTDLTRSFIAREIEPHYRLDTENLVNMACGLVSTAIQVQPLSENATNEEERIYKNLMNNCGRLLYSIAQLILEYGKEDMQNEFNGVFITEKSQVSDFIEKVNVRMAGLSKEDFDAKSKNYSGFIAKMDEKCSRIYDLLCRYNAIIKQTAEDLD